MNGGTPQKERFAKSTRDGRTLYTPVDVRSSLAMLMRATRHRTATQFLGSISHRPFVLTVTYLVSAESAHTAGTDVFSQHSLSRFDYSVNYFSNDARLAQRRLCGEAIADRLESARHE